jgi:hypothetical protein
MPDEYRLDLQLRELVETLPVSCIVSDTQHFLSERHELKDFFTGKKRFLMESFYRMMRKRYNILISSAVLNPRFPRYLSGSKSVKGFEPCWNPRTAGEHCCRPKRCCEKFSNHCRISICFFSIRHIPCSRPHASLVISESTSTDGSLLFRMHTLLAW